VTPVATGTIRTLAFGEVGASVWGCAWADGETCVLVVGGGDAPAASILGAAITGVTAGEAWSVTADGVELTATALGGTADLREFDGFDQLCQVNGAVRLDGVEHPLAGVGRRGLRAGIDLSRLDSIRDLSAWFAPDEGLTLTALRPRGAKGHDRDVVAANVFGEDGARTVADPRLSSAYSSDGRLLHTGLELWLDAENDQQYPRRAAAEAAGPGVRVDHDGATLTVWPLHWRSRGVEGAGVYVLASGAR
jgi:hypothetical protein